MLRHVCVLTSVQSQWRIIQSMKTRTLQLASQKRKLSSAATLQPIHPNFILWCQPVIMWGLPTSWTRPLTQHRFLANIWADDHRRLTSLNVRRPRSWSLASCRSNLSIQQQHGRTQAGMQRFLGKWHFPSNKTRVFSNYFNNVCFWSMIIIYLL